MTDYKAILRELMNELRIVAPNRVLTRRYVPFQNRKKEELQRGVFCVTPAGVDAYPYEHRPGDLGRFQIFIAAQGVVHDKAPEDAVDDAEFEAMNQLEALAAREFDRPDILAALTLLSVQQSAQIEHPYWWVLSRWEVFAPNE